MSNAKTLSRVGADNEGTACTTPTVFIFLYSLELRDAIHTHTHFKIEKTQKNLDAEINKLFPNLITPKKWPTSFVHPLLDK